MKRILVFDVGIKNLSFIDTYILEDANLKIVDWECTSIIDSKEKTTKVGISELTDAVLSFLFQRFDESFRYDHIYIENQPALMNGLMKSISMVIYTYFKINMPTSCVNFINASNKLKCSRAKLYILKKKMTYNERKKVACEITKDYLDFVAPDKKDWFNSLKKKDDYADTFLYAIYIAENKLV